MHWLFYNCNKLMSKYINMRVKKNVMGFFSQNDKK